MATVMPGCSSSSRCTAVLAASGRSRQPSAATCKIWGTLNRGFAWLARLAVATGMYLEEAGLVGQERRDDRSLVGTGRDDDVGRGEGHCRSEPQPLLAVDLLMRDRLSPVAVDHLRERLIVDVDDRGLCDI